MRVSIIIVNFNTYKLTRNCLRSVFEHTRDITFEVILVDNNSNECDPDIFSVEFPEIILIKSTINRGFAGGNNLGIAEAKGDYILLLNSDTVLMNNAVLIAVQEFQKDVTIGALSGKLIYPDGKLQGVAGRFPSIKNEWKELFRLNVFESEQKRAERLLGDCWDYSKETEADWVWGTFFLISRAVLNRFPDKKLHEDFFMYFEDVLWCYFIKKKLKLKIVYRPAPVIIHYLSGSSQNKDPKENFRNKMLPNECLFLIKNHNKFYAVLYYFIKGLHCLSLRKPENIRDALYYFRFIHLNILKRTAI
jgi:GT2 family glycosyltransferase